ncbi:MAG: restriction endonuclease subunit S [Rickettsiales bacterium]|jgi:hypothetical protein|nr:restriction endonuclease subunit S [Rickettsiales bacterium]
MTKSVKEIIDNIKNDNSAVVNVKEWKEFNIGKLFNPVIAASSDISKLDDGNIPFIGRSAFNNGLQKYVQSDKITAGKCITISMVGTYIAYWQEKDFIASQNILVLRNENVNQFIGLFLSSIFNKIIHDKYSYSHTLGKEAFAIEIIKLPVDKNGNPDWKYMNDYIANIYKYLDKTGG